VQHLRGERLLRRLTSPMEFGSSAGPAALRPCRPTIVRNGGINAAGPTRRRPPAITGLVPCGPRLVSGPANGGNRLSFLSLRFSVFAATLALAWRARTMAVGQLHGRQRLPSPRSSLVAAALMSALSRTSIRQLRVARHGRKRYYRKPIGRIAFRQNRLFLRRCARAQIPSAAAS